MNILFPYEKIRDVQEDFIKHILESIEKKRHLIAHAPTGIGKTSSVLSSVLPYIIKNELTLFFLTSRHTQHKIAIETLKEIRKKHNAGLNVVDLIGKRLMCSQNDSDLLPGSQFHEFCRTLIEKEECEFYENLWTKTGMSMETKNFLDINKNEILHVEEFLRAARKTGLCPYELAALKCKKANVIIADYYHIFNPSIREIFFKKGNKFLEKSVIIVDEAHNLPSRLREMMSSSLTTITLERALKEAENYEEAFRILIKINESFNRIMNNLEEEKIVRKEEFSFENFGEMLEILENTADQIREVKRRSYIGSVASFLVSWNGEDDGFVRISEKREFKGKVLYRLSYKCLDPSLNNKEIIDKSLLILMSGTLTPLEMYRDLLGFEGNVDLKEYENPFPKENRLSLIVPETTTKFTKRTEGMYKLIATKCGEFSNLIPGNLIIFFPSYHVMNEVYEFYKTLNNKTILIERQGITKEQKEEMLNKFRSYKKNGAVLLGVSGGSFSEGIDLPGDELRGAIIVGLPLSKPDLETRELINFYDNKFGKGWDYAYVFPAMIRVVQSAGRCIRSETDKGVIIFLDERYSMSNYLRCFPKDYNSKITKMPEEHIKKFFEEN